MAPNPNPSRITNEAWAFMERVLTLHPTMRNGGIYANKSGFHNTRAANSSSNYSCQGVRNQRGPSDKADAYDITYADAQSGNYSTISVHSQRLYVAGQQRDPRMKGWHEFFGNTDWDTQVEGWSYAKGQSSSSDSSHLWHCHLSECREMAHCWINKDGCYSVMSGESLAAWKARLGFPQQYCGVNLQLNTWGAAVCLLQVRLGISADGEFGPNTDTAVRNFQRSVGITADGIVGPTTWGKLAAGQTNKPAAAAVEDDMSMVHKSENGDVTYAVVTPGGWTEITEVNDEQAAANALAIVTGDSRGFRSASEYAAARDWWMKNIVPLNSGAPSDEQVLAMADRVAEKLLEAGVNLTEEDITEACKAAMREGTGA